MAERSGRWGGTSATRIDWRRGHFITVRIDRPSCACDECRAVQTAPEPAGFELPRSIVGNGLAAQIIVDKFADNILLNRQSTGFEREGLDLSNSTRGDTVRGVGGLLARIVGAMKQEQLAGGELTAWPGACTHAIPQTSAERIREVTSAIQASTEPQARIALAVPERPRRGSPSYRRATPSAYGHVGRPHAGLRPRGGRVTGRWSASRPT